MKSNIKKIVTIMLVFVMIFAVYVPASATEYITVSIKVRNTALKNGQVIYSNSNVVLPVTGNTNPTVLDAIQAVSGESQPTTSIVGNKTIYSQGIYKWYYTNWGPYISAVAVSGHSSTNKYFGVNGSASTWEGSSQSSYRYLNSLVSTELDLGYSAYDTFNNTVHDDGYLTEKDYNDYAGWMIIINNSTDNLGASTVLSNGDKIDLNYSMMMGLDLGQDSWGETTDHEWIECEKWHNNYSFLSDTWQ